ISSTGPRGPGSLGRTARALRRGSEHVGDGTGGRLARIPLRTKLLGITLALLIAALAITGWASQFVLRAYLVTQVDEDLPRAAFAVAHNIGPRGGGAVLSEYLVQQSYDDGTPPQLWDNPFLPQNARTPTLPTLTSTQARSFQGHPFTLRASDGTRWRV